MSLLPATFATRLARLPRGPALGLLALTLLAAIALVAYSTTLPPAIGSTPRGLEGKGDADTYRAILDLMRSGMGYYEAAHKMLIENGYGTSSVFNWRTPFYPSLVAFFPSTLWTQVLVGALALVAVLMAHRQASEGGPWLAGATAVSLAVSLVLIAAPEGVLFAEVPAGVLILCSALAYAGGRWRLGFAVGLAALFVRELAGIYVLVCLCLAVRERRWGEVLAWIAGLVAYAAFFGWHAYMVLQQLGPDEPSYRDGWVQFGGFGFILRSASFNGLLILAPLWAGAVLLPLSMLGLLAWRGAARAGFALLGFLFAFSIIGKPVNVYWGSLYTPLMMLGVPWALPALRDALRLPRSSAALREDALRSGS